MTSAIDTDLCVIGAGSAGLSVAAGASQMGARTVLVERNAMGGDCLNVGCVPSKALLAAAHAAQTVRTAGRFGVNGHEPEVDFARVHDHVHGVIKAIAPMDSQQRFEGLGVTVLRDHARFSGPETLQVGGTTVRAKRFVIATGSAPATPPIPGLEAAGFHTNETIFDAKARPAHLVIIGGGPIGLEMAQAHRRLGCQVTVLERASILPKDDPELAAFVRSALLGEGVDIREGVEIKQVSRAGNGVEIVLAGAEGDGRVVGTDLLVAAGRKPVLDDLGLDAAGVEHTKGGITVDRRLRTSNRRIFAMGDVIGGYQFTHVAGYHASIVIKNLLFRIPSKVDYRALPWVTYTAPELAQVGMTEALARERHGTIRVLRWSMHENDRAQTEGDAEGGVKVITDRKGRILGAGIVGPHAGELIHLWALAIAQRMKIGAIANMIAPYPTLGEAGKRAAGSYYVPTLFSDRTKRVVRFLLRLP